jgi:hypothetical protein
LIASSLRQDGWASLEERRTSWTGKKGPVTVQFASAENQ